MLTTPTLYTHHLRSHDRWTCSLEWGTCGAQWGHELNLRTIHGYWNAGNTSPGWVAPKRCILEAARTRVAPKWWLLLTLHTGGAGSTSLGVWSGIRILLLLETTVTSISRQILGGVARGRSLLASGTCVPRQIFWWITFWRRAKAMATCALGGWDRGGGIGVTVVRLAPQKSVKSTVVRFSRCHCSLRAPQMWIGVVHFVLCYHIAVSRGGWDRAERQM